LASTSGSTLRATTPGSVVPPPLLSIRLPSCANRAASMVAERRTLSRSGVIVEGL
jgi:hypothetical protein